MEYRGYRGHAERDDSTGMLHGHVLGIRDVITFQSKHEAGIVAAFQDCVDDYLDWCEEDGLEPERPIE